jgi:hypothetical protein
LEFALRFVSSAAATNSSLLFGSCRIRDITLLFAASVPVANFENQQQDKATDTEPNKPNREARPAEQSISVRDIEVRPSFDAFDQVVPAGPPRHRLPPSITEQGSDERGWRFGQGNTPALLPHHGSVRGQLMARARVLAQAAAQVWHDESRSI